ncbi:MAG: transglutaminase family protein, partial [Bacteroidetes bacterium]|nr:transglutaminase family protein [Bacteroidota bacterium]
MVPLKYFALGFLILVTGNLIAQFSDEFNRYNQLFPDDDKIRINYQTDVDIEIVNNEIEIKMTTLEEELYLNASAGHYSEQSIPFSTFYELTDIEASSFSFQNDKYKQIKVKDFKTKDDINGTAFYDDSKRVSFIYSNLHKGSKSTLLYKETIKDPRLLKPFFFGYFSSVLSSSLVITADKNITMEFKEFNTENIDLSFTKKEKNGNIIYHWVAKNIDKYESEDNSSNFRNYLPHIVPIIKSYNIKGKQVNLLNNVDGLYGWYYSLVKDVNKGKPNVELVKLVNSLTAGKETEIEKVRSIYYWVQQNIKYVAFEYALGGFVPRKANDVFLKKYGDCKDNSSILQQMFKIAGIKSYLTWIGTRDIPYTYGGVPTPSSANHMIITYINDSLTYFLDATGRYHSLGLPTSFIQGKEALISIDADNYEIKEVPVIIAENNFISDSINLEIEDATLSGKGIIYTNGYFKTTFFEMLEHQESSTELDNFYNLNLGKGSNKFLIVDFNETNKFDYDKDFIVDYSFNINDYVLLAGDEMYVNLNLTKY